MIVQANPEAAMVIGGGYLVLRGDAYEMKAQLKKGLRACSRSTAHRSRFRWARSASP
jgi:hypothetical protein